MSWLFVKHSAEGVWLHVVRVFEDEPHLLQRFALGPREALGVAPQLGGLEAHGEKLFGAGRGELEHGGELYGEVPAVAASPRAPGSGPFLPSISPRRHERLRQERLAPCPGPPAAAEGAAPQLQQRDLHGGLGGDASCDLLA